MFSWEKLLIIAIKEAVGGGAEPKESGIEREDGGQAAVEPERRYAAEQLARKLTVHIAAP